MASELIRWQQYKQMQETIQVAVGNTLHRHRHPNSSIPALILLKLSAGLCLVFVWGAGYGVCLLSGGGGNNCSVSFGFPLKSPKQRYMKRNKTTPRGQQLWFFICFEDHKMGYLLQKRAFDQRVGHLKGGSPAPVKVWRRSSFSMGLSFCFTAVSITVSSKQWVAFPAW